MIHSSDGQRATDREGKVTVLAINKGGATKTTTAANMAVMLTLLGCRTLVVDCAPEAHLTYTLGYTPGSLTFTLYDVLAGRCSLKDAIVPTSYDPNTRAFVGPTDYVNPNDPASKTLLETLNEEIIHGPDLLPLDMLHSTVDEDLRKARRFLKELLLRNALQPARRVYDYIICDTNPDLTNLLTVNAIFAADDICVPFIPEQLTVVGLKNLLNAIEEAQEVVRDVVHSDLHIAGILIAKVRDISAHRDVLEALRPLLVAQGIRCFRSAIKDSPKFLTAANRRSVVVLSDPLGEHSLAYWNFLVEYLQVIGGPGQEVVQATVQALLTERARRQRRREEERIRRQKGQAVV